MTEVHAGVVEEVPRRERAEHEARLADEAEASAVRECAGGEDEERARWKTLPPRVPPTTTSADGVGPVPRPPDADTPMVNPYWG